MKILLTADPELPVPPELYGGIERVIFLLIKGYQERGHEVVLCANGASKVPCKLVPWKGTSSMSRIGTVKNMLTLNSVTKKEKVDIVHSFSRLIYMTLLSKSNTPRIMSYQREPGVERIKKAYDMHANSKLVFTGCSSYISDQIATVAESYSIYNCVDFNEYDLAPTVEQDAPLVFLGRIEEIKGTHIAVQAAIKTNRRLVIAGNIPNGKEDYFNETVKPYLNDRIVYIGPVNDKQKNEMLKTALAMLMPITWNEPFGIVMPEAMACGTPVVGFARGSVKEVVEDGITGYKCDTLDELLVKIKQCETLDRTTVRKRAYERFDYNVIVDEYLSLYKKLIARS